MVVCDEFILIIDVYVFIKVLSWEYGVYKFKIVVNMVCSMCEG